MGREDNGGGKMQIGKYEISIALMILFAMVAMFFIGYYFAYNQSINDANEQIGEIMEEFKINYGLQDGSDFLFENIEIPTEDKENG